MKKEQFVFYNGCGGGGGMGVYGFRDCNGAQCNGLVVWTRGECVEWQILLTQTCLTTFSQGDILIGRDKKKKKN